ncbi:MAG: response regulator [Bacteroidetes bacterium]|nr:response regulator [Bacteroidota bacterium]
MKINRDPLIFIVEDDPMYSGMIESHLEQEYSLITVYSSAEECIDNLHRRPDIIIMDYHLDSMNGLEATKNIKAVNPDIQVILVSSQEQLQVAVNTLKYGAYDYVMKDEAALFRIKSLINKILYLNAVVTKNQSFNLLKRIGIMVCTVLVLGISLVLLLK